MPNDSLLTKWRCSELHQFRIDNELQACGRCQVVGDGRRLCHDYLGLEKFSSFVRTSTLSSPGYASHLVIIQELKYGHCTSVEFIDDYRLLITFTLRASVPPSLVLIDTGRDMGGTPISTTFHLSSHFSYSACPYLIWERGMHNPPPAESLAPFHQDPAQRIIALRFRSHPRYLVVRVGALLELFKDREGTEIGWDEWKDHLVVPSSSSGTLDPHSVQVSGCRLIYFWPTAGGSGFEMELFDFSMQGRTECLRKGSNEWLGETMCYHSSTGGRVQIPLEEFLGL
jgi:hypothetical protein